MDDQLTGELTNEQLEGVSGGYIFDAEVLTSGNASDPWEILDNNGDVVDSWDTKEMAEWVAKTNGLSTVELTWEQVQKLRKTGNPF